MHRDNGDRYQVQLAPSLVGQKRLGSYLIDAGLINRGQVEVALNDQKATGMKFGEVLATRGWVKQQTIEYLMEKVVLPERKQTKPNAPDPNATVVQTAQPTISQKSVRGVPQQHTGIHMDGNAGHQNRTSRQRSRSKEGGRSDANHSTQRRTPPITKPLPSVSTNADEGVNWVG